MRERTALVIFLAIWGWGTFVHCQDEPGAEPGREKKIVLVEVKGNRARSETTILAQVKTKPGMAFSQEKLNEDLKRLYATGFFSDVSLDLEDYLDGLKITFLVEERPVISELIFSGNRVFREERLRQIIDSKAGEALNLKTVKDDTNEISSLYENKGYHRARVGYEVNVEEETNQATVLIAISEGRRIKIKKIIVEGNAHFSDRKILKLLKTKRASLFNSGYFRREVFEVDKERIAAFYRSAGFLDARVDSRLDYLEPEARLMKITFTIEEGRRYLAGKIEITGNEIFDEDEILKRLEMTPDAVFTPEGLRRDYANIQNYYFDKGCLDTQVKADSQLNEETGRVDLIYQITEGHLTFVDKIDIRGNEITRDLVIRRELRIAPGEPFDGQKMKRSTQRLYNLGYFEDVAYDFEPGTAPDRKDLVVTVKEAKTGELGMGMGYSSVDRLVGFVEITQKNFDITNFPYFRGGGQRMRLRSHFGTETTNYDISFTEPWIFQRPISFGFDLYQRTWERSGFTGYGYDEERRGGDLRLGRALGEFNRTDLTYRLEDVKISDVAPEAGVDIAREEGKNTISSLGLYLERDTRDHKYNPTRGWLGYADVECAGGPFGGDKDFVKYRTGSSWYFNYLEKLVLELKLRAGQVDSYGDSSWVPIYERFFVGGSGTVRGYKERRIGPEDEVTGDPLGGRLMLVGNAEFTFPLIENLRGAIFYDTGYTWRHPRDFEFSDLKSGVGAGLRLNTPIGPISIDYGYALHPEAGEDRTRFHFGASHAFY